MERAWKAHTKRVRMPTRSSAVQGCISLKQAQDTSVPAQQGRTWEEYSGRGGSCSRGHA